MEPSKNSSLILWASLAAAATGILAVTAIMKMSRRGVGASSLHTSHRNVQEVLADCYNKIHEIEAQLPELMAPRTPSPRRRSNSIRKMTNGKPVLES